MSITTNEYDYNAEFKKTLRAVDNENKYTYSNYRLTETKNDGPDN